MIQIQPKYMFLVIFITVFISKNLAQNPPQLSNMGAQISVKSGFISVKGDVHNYQNGQIDNSDTIFFTGNWQNYVSQPFSSTVNNQGWVKMVGQNQQIGGNFPSNFYHLQLLNRAVKSALVDVHIYKQLWLNDCELAANNQNIIVFNTDLAAVQTGFNNIWGFVSNLTNGGLQRFTNQNGDYFFPMGAANVPNSVFRPVFLTPTISVLSSHKVGFFNQDATNQGFDRSQKEFSICDINERFFHKIQHTGAVNPVQVPVFTNILLDTVLDGSFGSLGAWENSSIWKEKSLLNAAFNPIYNLNSYKTDIAINYPDANYQPVALANVAPAIDLQLSANPICASDSLIATANGDFPTFDFFVDSFLLQSDINNIFSTRLNQGFSTVWVVGTNGVCGRTSALDSVEVFAAAVAQVSNDTIIVSGTNANLQASGGIFYDWFPTDALSCTNCPNPTANPDSTTVYIVKVENLDGCAAYDTVIVTVKNDVENILFIPNVLTPNSDGKNDTWFIKNIELFPSNKVRIINRWGDVVFVSERYNNDFDGRFSGGLLPAGTYYYIIDLGAGWGVFKGDVTIIR
jgi:gliding motility-associated-like protein